MSTKITLDEEKHKRMFEIFTAGKKTQQVGFRCTRELRQNIDIVSDTLGASVSDTITYMLYSFLQSEVSGEYTLHIETVKVLFEFVKEQAELQRCTTTEYIESLIIKEMQRQSEQDKRAELERKQAEYEKRKEGVE